MNASAAMQVEQDVVDFEPGDAVTPTGGILCGMRFVVVEIRAAARNCFGVEALIRMAPTRPGAPAPMWVPTDEIARYYNAECCSVCGSLAHPRCRGDVVRP